MTILDAIEAGDLDAVKDLLKTDPSLVTAPIGKSGLPPIVYAISCEGRSLEMIELLLGSGADARFRTDDGNTLFHFNVDLNGPECFGEMPYAVARTLKEKGADFEARNHYGWTPLLKAALEGTLDEFKALLEVGADWKVRFEEDSLPCHIGGEPLEAAITDDSEKISALIEAGFHPDAAYLEKIKEGLEEAKVPEDTGYVHKDIVAAYEKSLELVQKHLSQGEDNG